MASVRKIQNKKWISYKIEVSNGYDISGKKIRKTTTFIPDFRMTKRQQKKALEKFVFEFEEKVKGNNSIHGENLTFEAFTAKWRKVYGDNHFEQSTYSRYNKIINQIIIPELGQCKLGQLKPFHIESFYASLIKDGVRKDGKPGGYSHGTIQKINTVLSSMLSVAQQWEFINSNPCQKAKLPRQQKETKLLCFTLDQAKRFLQFLDTVYSGTDNTKLQQRYTPASPLCSAGKNALRLQYKVLFQIALFGGLRRGELLGLEWKNVDFRQHTIFISQSANRVDGKIIVKPPKTPSSIRMVTLPEPVMELLQEYRQEQELYRKNLAEHWKGTDWLFIQADGEIMSIGNPYSKFHNIILRYNKTVPAKDHLPLIPLHGLRHTNASILVQSNKVDIKTVSSKLGHSALSTTMQYIHSYEESEKETAYVLESLLLEKECRQPVTK